MNTNKTFLENGSTAKEPTKAEPNAEPSGNSSDLSRREPDQQDQTPRQRAETDADAQRQIAELLSPAANEDDDQAGAADAEADASEPGEADPSRANVGDDDKVAKNEDADGSDDGEGDSAVSVKDLAEHLGTNAQRVYKDLQVPLGNGESISLGELKDAHQLRETSRSEIAERETSLQERESAVFASQQELQTIQSEIAPFLTPETVQGIQAKHSASQVQERTSLLEKAPEFTDQVKFDAFREDLVEMMNGFGFEAHEVVITDHRLLLMGREMLKMQRTIKRWGDAVEDGKLKGHKSTTKAKGSPVSKARGLKRQLADAAASNDSRTKVAAVSALIGN